MSGRGRSRLELTWANKDRRLLSHGDDTYEWVDAVDWRVSEVRLLNAGRDFGESSSDNLLIHGDALYALTSLTSAPEYAERYLGKVKLVYIDPPFNTQQAFTHYDDAVEHSVWLTMLRDRLMQIKKLLSPDGSVWVHLDDAEVHRARSVMDEVFGPENFAAQVIWEKTTSGRNDAKLFSIDQDYIIVYAKDSTAFRPTKSAHTAASDKAYKNPDDDPRGPWREVDYKGPKTAEERPNLYYPVTNPFTGAEVWPRRDAVWRYSPEEHARHVKENLLWWGKTGNYTYPKRKMFLVDRSSEGTPPRTLWTAAECDTTRRAKDEIKKLFPGQVPFATPKPERLMHKVISVGSQPGDIVLDCFAGSGTTAAVAHKTGRRWVTVELSEENIATFVGPRLEKVVKGEDPGGITPYVEWTGGGGFREISVAPSLFTTIDDVVVLADWATNGDLAKGVCAQVGYDYRADPPFAGRRGNSRLAVIDGLLTTDIVDYLVARLAEKERLLVVAQALEPGVEDYLRKARSGSKARKVPRDLARTGRRTSETVRLSAKTATNRGTK